MDFQSLDPENTLIVTASRRQSRFIKQSYQTYQLKLGKTVWPSLEVIPWSAFIDQCWAIAQQNFCADSKNGSLLTRLNSGQSRYLWDQMVANSVETDNLLNVKQTQSLSYDAWRSLCQWRIDDLTFLPGDEDQTAFDKWQASFQSQLNTNQWIDPFQVPSWLLDNDGLFINDLEDNIAFFGFAQKHPQQVAMMELISTNKNVLKLMQTKLNQEASIKSLDSPEQEWVAAIRWAKETLQKDCDINLAIIVPELEQNKSNIERIIQHEFYAKTYIDGGDALHSIHDISVDESLLKQPLVEVIINLLMLSAGRLNKKQLQNLLLSPFLYSTQEQHWQATKLELTIRKSNKDFYTYSNVQEWLMKKESNLDWFSSLLKWKEENSEGKISFREYINRILKLLSELHWSSYTSLSSREFQLQNVFIKALKSAVELQRVAANKLSESQAFNLMNNYLEQQSFHQQIATPRLQVIGLLEAVGLEFDAAWLLGANDKVLPQKAQPNPFLSKAMQLKHQMPGSSQQRELDYARSLLQSLMANNELIISYATHDGEQEQMISPLLFEYTKLEYSKNESIEKIELHSDIAEYIDGWPRNEQLEIYSDNTGLPLPNSQSTRGGTGLLKTHAASPFDAYLRYRLRAHSMDKDDLGISFMERGNLFHQVMQIIWQLIESQVQLLQLESEELNKLVSRSIDTVLNNTKRHLYLLNNDAFYQVEKKRLSTLVQSSLLIDKKRQPFSVIGCEVKRTIDICGLTLQITIDRIDQLEDNSLLIIDYKTGTPKLIDLLNDPIGEPQLLLYAVCENKLETPVSGILFYQAHLKGSKYIGFTESADQIKGVKALKDLATNPYKASLLESIETWRKTLDNIAQSFKSGDTNVTEYSGNYSDHLNINRWSERDIPIAEILDIESLEIEDVGIENLGVDHE